MWSKNLGIFDQFWSMWNEVGEMMGSFFLTFFTLVTLLAVKQVKFGLDTELKKRMFLGALLAIAIFVALYIARGFGAHGQINPAITFIVAAATGSFNEVPAIIGFQIIGGITAGAVFIGMMAWLGMVKQVGTLFTFNKQPINKAIGFQVFSNAFWLLPIAAGVASYLANANPNSHTHGGINWLELVLVASFAKVMYAGIFEHFAHGAANVQIWIGKFMVTLIGTKGKITGKEILTESTDVFSNLVMGFALGCLAHPFAEHLGAFAK